MQKCFRKLISSFLKANLFCISLFNRIDLSGKIYLFETIEHDNDSLQIWKLNISNEI